MSGPIDVLLFVADPGAANYAAGLPAALRAQGLAAVLAASGAAVPYLRDRGVACTELDAGAEARSVLSRWSPRLLAAGTAEDPDTPGLRLIDAARVLGLPTVGLVDGFPNAAHRFRGAAAEPLAHAPHWLLVPDAATAAAYVALGMEAGRVKVCGHPQWDRVREEARRLLRADRTALRASHFPGCAPDRPALVFAAEISTGLDPSQYRRSADYSLAGSGQHSGRTEIVLDEFLEAVGRLERRPYLVLRLHPKNGPGDFPDHRGEFDRVSAGGPPLELMYAADAVVGMTSMLLQEAVLLGRATLSILPREAERAWLPAFAAEATPCATRKPEVRRALADLLEACRKPAVPASPVAAEEAEAAVAAGAAEAGAASSARAAEFMAALLAGEAPGPD